MEKDLSENWFIERCWLTNQEEWPEDITTDPSPDTKSKAKIIKDVLLAAVIQNGGLLLLIQKFSFLKTTRITASLL